jgi:hypothetical protein
VGTCYRLRLGGRPPLLSRGESLRGGRFACRGKALGLGKGAGVRPLVGVRGGRSLRTKGFQCRQ